MTNATKRLSPGSSSRVRRGDESQMSSRRPIVKSLLQMLSRQILSGNSRLQDQCCLERMDGA
jgi:hypothetical protein